MAALTRPWIQGYLVVLILYLVLAGWRIKPSKARLILVGTAMLITPWLHLGLFSAFARNMTRSQ